MISVKKAKILSIMLASAMVSASLGITPIFAAEDVSINNGGDAIDLTAEESSTTSAAVRLRAVAASAESNVKVDVVNGTSANSISPTITITNTGSEKLDLKNVKLRYFYTADGDENQIFNCYYAGTTNGEYSNLTGNIVGKIAKLSSKTTNADSYIEISFNGGSLNAGQSAQIQAAVNKDGWQAYNQSDDYSYNNSKHIAVYENNKLVWGSEPDGSGSVPEIISSELDKSSIEVDKASLNDEIVNIKLNGNTFTGITGLTQGKDYTVTGGNVVTIKSEYLKSLAVGNTSLTFNFNQGDSQKLNINVKDTGIVLPPVEDKDAVISPVTVDYNKADITVQMTLNGKTLSDIKNNNAVLVQGTDYILDGDKVVLKQAYLDTLSEGQATNLTFDFSNGKTQTLTVNVPKAAVTEGLVIDIADVNAKAGEEITIPVTITGIDSDKGLNGCNFKLKYDTDVFENVTITPGDIINNSAKTFFKTVNKDTGSISIMFADSTGKELEAILKDGLFMNINLKVKDDVEDTTTQLEVTKAGKFFDKSSNAYTVNYKVGKITIGDGSSIDVPVIVDSTLTKTSATYDIKKPEAVEVGMVLNGNELSSIKNGDKVLSEGVDYTVDGTVVTFAPEYLADLSEGNYDFTFSFTKGADAAFNLNVIKSSEESEEPVVIDSPLTKTSADYDSANPEAVEVGMVLNGNELSSIKSGDKVLSEGVDYTVDGTVVTFAPEYLTGLAEGSNELTFSFSSGADASFTINVVKAEVEDVLAASIGKIEAKAGDTVVLPVTLTKAPEQGIATFAYKINYDPKLIDVLSVKAGDAITNPELNFMAEAYENDSMISVLFIDSALTEEETIKNAGVLANIELKVKADVPNGIIPIEFKNDGNSFYGIDGNEMQVRFDAGSITVK